MLRPLFQAACFAVGAAIAIRVALSDEGELGWDKNKLRWKGWPWNR